MSAIGGRWLIAAAITAAAVFALLQLPDAPPAVDRGAAAPSFELASLDGQPVSLASLRGRVVLLNFWATWCKPCEDEMPAMERLYSALRDDGFELLAISVDEERAPVAEFAERMALSFPILLDLDRTVSDAYQTFRYPESLLIDGEGVVLERYVGPREWDAEAYVARIRRLLGEGAGS